jgi:hypothetical protein
MGDRKSRSGWWLRGAGLTIGLCAVVLAVSSWRMPAGSGTGDADVIFISTQSGGIAVSPVGPFLQANGLRPSGRSAEASIDVANHFGREVVVQLRAAADEHDLDELLHVEIVAGSETVYRGTLGGLRAWTTSGVVLARTEARSLRFRVWIPGTAGSGYEGRVETVAVELRTAPASRAG